MLSDSLTIQIKGKIIMFDSLDQARQSQQASIILNVLVNRLELQQRVSQQSAHKFSLCAEHQPARAHLLTFTTANQAAEILSQKESSRKLLRTSAFDTAL